MGQAAAIPIDIQASDVSGQKTVKVSDIQPELTIGTLIKGLLGKMGLVRHDSAGEPLQYTARLERDGRHLHSAESVRDALEADDRLVLQPRVNAG